MKRTAVPAATLQFPSRPAAVAAVLLAGALFAAPAAEPGEDRDPTTVLHKEHEIIRQVATAAEATAEKIRDSGEVDVAKVAKLHDFFKNFADRCHHAKEEDELFPVLRKTMEETTIIDLLLNQHEAGRILLGGIAEKLSALEKNGTQDDRQALARYLEEYAHLMARHIAIENEYLWPRVSAQLDEAQKEEVSAAFRRIEAEELGQGFHEKYHAMAMEILGEDGR